MLGYLSAYFKDTDKKVVPEDFKETSILRVIAAKDPDLALLLSFEWGGEKHHIQCFETTIKNVRIRAKNKK